MGPVIKKKSCSLENCKCGDVLGNFFRNIDPKWLTVVEIFPLKTQYDSSSWNFQSRTSKKRKKLTFRKCSQRIHFLDLAICQLLSTCASFPFEQRSAAKSVFQSICLLRNLFGEMNRESEVLQSWDVVKNLRDIIFVCWTSPGTQVCTRKYSLQSLEYVEN